MWLALGANTGKEHSALDGMKNVCVHIPVEMARKLAVTTPLKIA
jgi:hypothetical protein